MIKIDKLNIATIKPCPFCGGAAYPHVDSFDGDTVWLMCNDCQAEGPICGSGYEVVKMLERWNLLSECVNKKGG